MWLGLLEGGGRGWGGAQGPEVGGRGGPGRGPGPAALHLVFRLFTRAWGFEPGVWVGRRGDGGGACLPGLGGFAPGAALHLDFRLFARAWGFEPGV